jgi:hypothetical protein
MTWKREIQEMICWLYLDEDPFFLGRIGYGVQLRNIKAVNTFGHPPLGNIF